MENNNAIVEQMKEQMRYFKSRGRIGLIISAVFVVVFVSYLSLSTWQSREYFADDEFSCDQILDCLDQGKAQEALAVALEIIESCPDYYYAHSCLADAYLANGDVSNALKHATIAFKFYPSETMEEELQIIQKRAASEESD